MPYSAHGYRIRAVECVRLANLTKEEILQAAILRLRQDYLQTADRLVVAEAAGGHSIRK